MYCTDMKNDYRIDHITIPIGLKDVLNKAGSTIESTQLHQSIE